MKNESYVTTSGRVDCPSQPVLTGLIDSLGYHLSEISYANITMTSGLNRLMDTISNPIIDDTKKGTDPYDLKSKIEFLIELSLKIKDVLNDNCKKINNII